MLRSAASELRAHLHTDRAPVAYIGFRSISWVGVLKREAGQILLVEQIVGEDAERHALVFVAHLGVYQETIVDLKLGTIVDVAAGVILARVIGARRYEEAAFIFVGTTKGEVE